MARVDMSDETALYVVDWESPTGFQTSVDFWFPTEEEAQAEADERNNRLIEFGLSGHYFVSEKGRILRGVDPPLTD